MDKTAFKQKTLEIIEDMHQRELEIATKVIDNMDESKLTEFEDNYMASKAFCAALSEFLKDNVNTRQYTLGFVRRHKDAVRRFLHEITYNRF